MAEVEEDVDSEESKDKAMRRWRRKTMNKTKTVWVRKTRKRTTKTRTRGTRQEKDIMEEEN